MGVKMILESFAMSKGDGEKILFNAAVDKSTAEALKIIDTEKQKLLNTIKESQEALDKIESKRDDLIESITSVMDSSTDTSLTLAGIPADAKSTGDKINEVDSRLSESIIENSNDINRLRDEVVFSSYDGNYFAKIENKYVTGAGTVINAPSSVQGYFYSIIEVEEGDVVTCTIPSFYTSAHAILSLWKNGVCNEVIRKGASTQFTESFVMKHDADLYYSANTNYPVEITIIKKHSNQLEKIKSAVGLYAHRNFSYYEKSAIPYKAINKDGAILSTSSSLGYFYVSLVLNKNDIIFVNVDGMASSISVLSVWKNDVFIKNLRIGVADMSEISYQHIIDEDNTEIRFCARGTQKHDLNVYICDEESYKTVEDAIMNTVKHEYGYLNDFKFEYAINKVLCIGDSLTAGAYYGNWHTEAHNIGDDIQENYPKVLGRMLNCEVTNGGVNGDYPTRWVVDELPKYNLNDYDTFVIWLGTNNGLTDTLEQDVEPYSDYNQYANTETGKYCYLIEKIKAENPSAFIMLNKIFYSSGNLDVANVVIDKIASKYSLHVNDLSMYNHNVYPEYHANQGNIHLGKAGNIVVANTIVNNIHKWFAENPMLCEFHVTNTIER